MLIQFLDVWVKIVVMAKIFGDMLYPVLDEMIVDNVLDRLD